MAQALGAVVGQQLDRRIAKFAAALGRIGLASLLYGGSVAINWILDVGLRSGRRGVFPRS
jgi:hypothetical protein